MMKLRLLRGFLPRPRPLKIFIRRSMGHSADTSDSSTNQDREAGRNSSKAEHSNPAPIGQFYRFLCRAVLSDRLGAQDLIGPNGFRIRVGEQRTFDLAPVRELLQYFLAVIADRRESDPLFFQ